jgi:hypothetical protein
MLQFGLVWSAALMTPLAGFPFFECRCPNGQIKPVCLGAPSKTTGCCCGGGCCSPDSGGGNKAEDSAPSAKTEEKPSANEGEKPSCCQGHTPQVAQATQSHGSVEGTNPFPSSTSTKRAGTHGQVVSASCCQRTLLAEAEFVAVTPGKAGAKENPTAGVDVAAPETACIPFLPIPPVCRLAWDGHQLAPPTDLVIRLQHFVI